MSVNITQNTVLVDPKTGKATREFLRFIESVNRLTVTKDFVANGSTAVSLDPVAPDGASPSPQEWLKIDHNGTTRYVPLF